MSKTKKKFVFVECPRCNGICYEMGKRGLNRMIVNCRRCRGEGRIIKKRETR